MSAFTAEAKSSHILLLHDFIASGCPDLPHQGKGGAMPSLLTAASEGTHTTCELVQPERARIGAACLGRVLSAKVGVPRAD